jgi:hypothetical protein
MRSQNLPDRLCCGWVSALGEVVTHAFFPQRSATITSNLPSPLDSSGLPSSVVSHLLWSPVSHLLWSPISSGLSHMHDSSIRTIHSSNGISRVHYYPFPGISLLYGTSIHILPPPHISRYLTSFATLPCRGHTHFQVSSIPLEGFSSVYSAPYDVITPCDFRAESVHSYPAEYPFSQTLQTLRVYVYMPWSALSGLNCSTPDLEWILHGTLACISAELDVCCNASLRGVMGTNGQQHTHKTIFTGISPCYFSSLLCQMFCQYHLGMLFFYTKIITKGLAMTSSFRTKRMLCYEYPWRNP